jgi:hypothetical protein
MQLLLNPYRLRYYYAIHTHRGTNSPSAWFRRGYDMRRKTSREALTAFMALIEATPRAELDAMAKRHKERARAKYQPTPPVNVLSCPIYCDYRRNRCDLWKVSDSALQFRGGRNHHAKNDFDRKVLQVLKKHFKK